LKGQYGYNEYKYFLWPFIQLSAFYQGRNESVANRKIQNPSKDEDVKKNYQGYL